MNIPIPLSKILSLLAPVISTLAATAATWLVVHVHLFATFHVTQSNIASAISQAVVWGITALGTYLVQHGVIQEARGREAHAWVMKQQAEAQSQVAPHLSPMNVRGAR